MHFNGLKLSGALEEFSIYSRFLGPKCKTQLFEETKRIDCSFYRIEAQKITNPSSQLEKTHKILEFLLITDFFMIFIKSSFSTFSDYFENNQLYILFKIIVCVLFHVYAFDQTHYSLISPFSNDIFFQNWCPLPVLT